MTNAEGTLGLLRRSVFPTKRVPGSATCGLVNKPRRSPLPLELPTDAFLSVLINFLGSAIGKNWSHEVAPHSIIQPILDTQQAYQEVRGKDCVAPLFQLLCNAGKVHLEGGLPPARLAAFAGAASPVLLQEKYLFFPGFDGECNCWSIICTQMLVTVRKASVSSITVLPKKRHSHILS